MAKVIELSDPYIEGKCEDCWYFWGFNPTCHHPYTYDVDVEKGGCVFFEGKWEPDCGKEKGAFEEDEKE